MLKSLADILPVVDVDPIVGLPAPVIHSVLNDRPFAVVDLETTGFAPRRRDRIIEIAIIRLDPDGALLGEWSTMVNPGRSVGASWVHGMTDADVAGAPRFADIAHLVAEQFDGAVLVAHNLPFDKRFLQVELERAGQTPPFDSGVCTLEIDRQVHHAGRRKLADCCTAVGIGAGEEGHRALADARKTAELLRHYLKEGKVDALLL